MPRKQAIHGTYFINVYRNNELPHDRPVYSLCGVRLTPRAYWQRQQAKYTTRKCPRSVTCKSCQRTMRMFGQLPKEKKNV